MVSVGSSVRSYVCTDLLLRSIGECSPSQGHSMEPPPDLPLVIREYVTVPGCCCCMPLLHNQFDGLVHAVMYAKITVLAAKGTPPYTH